MFSNPTQGARELFRVSDFPIKVQWTFLLLAAFFIFQNFGNTLVANASAFLWLPVLFVSILVHELGHAFAIRKYGYGNSEIVLHGMGGVCISYNSRYTPRDGLKIALAGPLFGFLLGLPFLILFGLGVLNILPLPEVLQSFLWKMVFVNIGWSIFNLVPLFPLDGGRALYYGLRTKKNPDQSAKTTGLVGLITATIMGALALASGQIFIGFFAIMFGLEAWRAWKHGARYLYL